MPVRPSCDTTCLKGHRLLPAIALTILSAAIASAAPPRAFVRVSQIGYETTGDFVRAFLMSSSDESPAMFQVRDEKGKVSYRGPVGELLGTWKHSSALVYRVYPLDFRVATGRYTITVNGRTPAVSPAFAVDTPEVLYPGLLLNAKFFYETGRDGRNFVPNALRNAPAHLNDTHARVFTTPLLDDNDNIATVGSPLRSTGGVIDAEGGWWDAGDYMKYVETISYTVALQELGVRDFPNQMGKAAPFRPPAPPLAISYSGNAAGAPASADFSSEANFGLRFLLRMWDDKTRTLFYQVGNSQDWNNFEYLSDYDIWRLPQADDDWNGCSADAHFICNRPVFRAGPPGSKISPNLAGRLTADFAVCYQLNRKTYPALANRCLKSAEDIYELADTSLADPAASVDSGTCKTGCLLTIVPFDGYPETVWDDDMELGATELYVALRLAAEDHAVPSNLWRKIPAFYLAQALHYANGYNEKVYKQGFSDSLNLYDVSGLAHFELWRALGLEWNSVQLAGVRSAIKNQLLKQVDDALAVGSKDPWGFGASWSNDTTSHGAGLSVMASEAFYLTGVPIYNVAAQRWMANILGANAWGSSFIVGDGSAAFPNCIQHQVANLAGALDGTLGGTPILWGAATEGPSSAATSGLLDGMLACPANGADRFARFNGNDAVYQNNVQSYSTTEPAIDLTATSFLMWSWRLAHEPAGSF